MKTLIAASVAFAFPLAALAGGDKASTGASSGSSASSAGSGAEKMFQAMDKNKDGFVTKAEAAGTPHDKDFAKLDKNSDGKLSPQEHAAAPEHAGDKSGSSSAGTSKGSKY
jgi:hypothetical protein